MSHLPHGSEELERVYRNRFDEHIEYRNEVWKILTRQFFSSYAPPSSTVLDLGCGYGEFINNIQCAQKYAMDLNPRAKEFLHSGIKFLEQDCSAAWPLPDNHLDVVFTSNFFEHLPNKQAIGATLSEAWRCLRPNGTFMAIGPNANFIGGAYWDFWDHHIALTDRSLAEALTTNRFRVQKAVRQFLPYTMVNRRRSPLLLVQAYLKMPFMWRFFGKQFFVVATKPAV